MNPDITKRVIAWYSARYGQEFNKDLFTECESNESRSVDRLPDYEDAFRIYGVNYQPPYEALKKIVGEIDTIRNRVYIALPG